MKYVVITLILATIVAASATYSYACKNMTCRTYGNTTTCSCW